jgi:hypothetical protein
MKTFVEFLTALVLLAIVQNITIALGIVLLIVVVMAATVYPRQALATAVLIGLFTLAIKQPLACAAGLGAIALAVTITKRIRRRRQRHVRQTSPLLLSWSAPDSTHGE